MGYLRPAEDTAVECELEVKRSRFIALVGRAGDEQAARSLIDAARSRFPDARHHCSAYLYHVEDAQPVERSSDDGEPSGTAGRPILDVLKGSGMLDVCVVVVRYFGGIKLGAGGLVHAYSEAAAQALEQVQRVQRSEKQLYSFGLPHSDAGRVEAELRNRSVTIVDTHYADQVHYTVAVEPGAEIDGLLAELTQGAASARDAGRMWVELG